MTEIHDRDVWRLDRRKIIAGLLKGEKHPFLSIDGFDFERFERNGEQALIPFLRATRNGVSIEAPLRRWMWIQCLEIDG